jgi:hypothetical protein
LSFLASLRSCGIDTATALGGGRADRTGAVIFVVDNRAAVSHALNESKGSKRKKSNTREGLHDGDREFLVNEK